MLPSYFLICVRYNILEILKISQLLVLYFDEQLQSSTQTVLSENGWYITPPPPGTLYPHKLFHNARHMLVRTDILSLSKLRDADVYVASKGVNYHH